MLPSGVRACKRVLTVAVSASTSKYVVPRNVRQGRYLDMLQGDKPDIVVATGPAGCGKTLLATYMGVQKLTRREVDRLIITRPAVSVDEQHGFLPGSLEKKMEPWIRPVMDMLRLYHPKTRIDGMIRDEVIEICPLAFMRGRTFDRSWILCDEAQNMTPNQMLMVMTRLGTGSKLVITGDPQQHDRGFADNGLVDFLDRVEWDERGDWLGVVEFGDDDVERNPVIPYVLDLYKKPDMDDYDTLGI